MIIILGSVLGGVLVLFLLCCLCGTCYRDPTKSPTKSEYYQKSSRFPVQEIEFNPFALEYAHTSGDNEALKSDTSRGFDREKNNPSSLYFR